MALQQFQEQASLEKGDSPRGGEMPAGQRGPLSTRGTSVAGGGVPQCSVGCDAHIVPRTSKIHEKIQHTPKNPKL